MAKREIETHSAEETVELGKKIGATVNAPVLILLSGDLGAGKTTLTKGIVAGAGAAQEEEVTSPTFTLIHKYVKANGANTCPPVYHIDLYRIEDRQALETLGLDDVFNERAIIVVEWPERLRLPSDWPLVRITLENLAEDSRRIQIEEGAEGTHERRAAI